MAGRAKNSFLQKMAQLVADYSITLAGISFKSGVVQDKNLPAAVTNDSSSLQGAGGHSNRGPGNAQGMRNCLLGEI